MKTTSKLTCIKDLIIFWGITLILEMLSVVMLDTRYEKVHRFTGYRGFFEILIFFLILTIIRLTCVVKNEQKNEPYQRGYTKEQFNKARILFTLVAPGILIWIHNAYFHYTLFQYKWMWILQIAVCFYLANIIIMQFQVNLLYLYNLPVFVAMMIFTIIGAMNISFILTMVLVKSVIVGLMIVGIYILLEIAAVFTFPGIIIWRRN